MNGGDGVMTHDSRSFGVAIRGLHACMVVFGFSCMAGCSDGPQTGEVTGTVTIDGQPVAGLLVQFEPQDGIRLGLPPDYGPTDAQGRYRAIQADGKTGAAVGLNHVRLTAIEREGGEQAKIHARYAGDYTFWFEVAPGTNTYDIELKADPFRRGPAAPAKRDPPAETPPADAPPKP